MQCLSRQKVEGIVKSNKRLGTGFAVCSESAALVFVLDSAGHGLVWTNWRRQAKPAGPTKKGISGCIDMQTASLHDILNPYEQISVTTCSNL